MPRKSRPRRPASPEAEVESPPRIIGGRLRGTRIPYTGDRRTRPMKERVRENVFNLLGDGVPGMLALDLFAGTGALGLEAISRGAPRAVFIERHFPTCRTLRDCLAALELEERCRVLAGDTFYWYPRLLGDVESSEEPFETSLPWLIFCAPPYDLYVEAAEPMDTLLNRFAEAAPLGSRLVVESDNRYDQARLPASLTWNHRSYEPAEIAIGVKRE